MNLRSIFFVILCCGGLLNPRVSWADIVTEWNSAALDVIRTSSVDTFNASRDLAILHASIMDAVNGVNHQDASLYVGGSATSGSSLGAAAAAAGLKVMSSLFGSNSTFDNLYANQIASMGGPSTSVNNGATWGTNVANSILTYRSSDGASGANTPFAGSNTQGQWRPTPPAYQTQPILPGWGNVTPFALNTGSQYRPNGPTTLDSSQYAADYNQVKSLGSQSSGSRTTDQTNIANFWNGAQNTVTTWNKVAQSLASSYNLNQTAKIFASLDISLADAGIAAMDAKYTYASWRPVSAIRDEAAHDGGPGDNLAITGDAVWLPLIITPASPEYVSHTSAMSGAAATSLASLLGNFHVLTITSDTNGDGVVDLTRNYASLSDISSESSLSGIYAGNNFQSSNQDGAALGNAIGQYVSSNYFTPVPEPSSAVYVLALGLFLIMKRRNRLRA